MAASVIQQPPSPPHTRQHYFPPIHHPAKPQYVQPPIPQPPAPRPAPVLPPVQEEGITVRSKLPLGFHPPPSQQPTQAELEQQMQEPEGTQEATITWRGGGKDVYLTGADTREPRVKMIHEPGSKTTFFTTVRLPPGNHPLRFIVDDQPKCTDTLPTATDTDGTLINYIEIPSPTNSPARSRTNTGERTGSNIGLSDTQPGGKWFAEMEWTGQIPPRLFKLAGEEEAYLAARAAQNPSNGSAPRMHPSKQPPLPPPPPVPYPPSLPRHLEKVILNNPTRNPPNPAILSASSSARPRIMGDRSGAVFGDRGMLNGRGPIANGGTEGTGDDNSVLPVPNHVVLNHLGTSAIKNGVLAVGTTTRYHRKYISTIYYKPVMPYSS